eukprot:g51740.t1
MLRRRRIAKAKAIVGQILGEAHGFTDAEVEEFTLQYMNLSDQLMFKPGDNQQAKIATQTLLHMDYNVMSDQQLVKQRKELTQEVIPKYGLEGSKDGKRTSLMCKCKEDLVELKQYAGEMLKTFESWEKEVPQLTRQRQAWHTIVACFVPMNRHVPDFLHMMLRICGRMVDFLMRENCDGRPDTPWGADIPPDSPSRPLAAHPIFLEGVVAVSPED